MQNTIPKHILRLKFILILGLFSISTPVLSQIPEYIKNKADSLVTTLMLDSVDDNYLSYNCKSSYVDIGGRRWQGCTPITKDTAYFFAEGLKQYTSYQLVYDFIKGPIIKDFTFIRLDHKGKLITYQWFLYEECVPDYNKINIAKDQAVSIAKKNELAKGLQAWKIELRHLDIDNYVTTSKNEGAMFHWLLTNYLDLGDGCEMEGMQMIIDAESGSLIDSFEWKTKCID